MVLEIMEIIFMVLPQLEYILIYSHPLFHLCLHIEYMKTNINVPLEKMNLTTPKTPHLDQVVENFTIAL